MLNNKYFLCKMPEYLKLQCNTALTAYSLKKVSYSSGVSGMAFLISIDEQLQ